MTDTRSRPDSAKLPNPSGTAMAVVAQFSWGTNVSRGGHLLGQQYVVAEAIDGALSNERNECAAIVQRAINVLFSKRWMNKLDRFAVEELVACRNKIHARGVSQ